LRGFLAPAVALSPPRLAFSFERLRPSPDHRALADQGTLAPPAFFFFFFFGQIFRPGPRSDRRNAEKIRPFIRAGACGPSRRPPPDTTGPVLYADLAVEATVRHALTRPDPAFFE